MIRYSFKIFCLAFSACFCCAGSLLAEDNNPHTDKMVNEKLNLTQEWDKVFPKSDKVTHRKVSFRNRYGIMLAADLYMPRNVNGKLPAIAVSGPFGAVKEQSAGLYAQTMAERGFLTIAFDPSYTGESGGFPRYVASPDINTEDFCAAVDYLSTRDDVDSERIGIIGICGWGGMAVNAAAIDTRIKATVTSTMYDMSRVNANGYFDAMDADVISFEASRGDLVVLDAIHDANFETEAGPGVYDIHSPRIPSEQEIEDRIYEILKKMDVEKVWINPDCGLKTRGNAETWPSLENLVAAAKAVRAKLAK